MAECNNLMSWALKG